MSQKNANKNEQAAAKKNKGWDALDEYDSEEADGDIGITAEDEIRANEEVITRR